MAVERYMQRVCKLYFISMEFFVLIVVAGAAKPAAEAKPPIPQPIANNAFTACLGAIPEALEPLKVKYNVNCGKSTSSSAPLPEPDPVSSTQDDTNATDDSPPLTPADVPKLPQEDGGPQAVAEDNDNFGKCFTKRIYEAEWPKGLAEVPKSIGKEDIDTALKSQLCQTSGELKNVDTDQEKVGVFRRLSRWFASKAGALMFSDWRECAKKQPMRLDEFFCQKSESDKWMNCNYATKQARLRRIKVNMANITEEERNRLLSEDIGAVVDEEKKEDSKLMKGLKWVGRKLSSGIKKIGSVFKSSKHKDDSTTKEPAKPGKFRQWMALKFKKMGSWFMNVLVGCDYFRAKEAAAAAAKANDTSANDNGDAPANDDSASEQQRRKRGEPKRGGILGSIQTCLFLHKNMFCFILFVGAVYCFGAILLFSPVGPVAIGLWVAVIVGLVGAAYFLLGESKRVGRCA